MKNSPERSTQLQEPSKFSIKDFFKTDTATGISRARLWLLKSFYLLNVVLLGSAVWTEIFTHKGPWEPMPGVAFSFWAAFSLLAILGILHPLKMLPLLLIQFSYKLIWLIIVAYPLWSADCLAGSPAQELAETNFGGIIADILIIPWPYVLKNYIFKTK
jgi:hypothetical protein